MAELGIPGSAVRHTSDYAMESGKLSHKTNEYIRYLPTARPAKKAVPRLVILSVCLLRSIGWFVRSAIS